MKVNYSWLRDFAPLKIDLKTFCDGMTRSGSKVEAAEQENEQLTGVVTGRILSIDSHPNADKLVICQVDIKRDEAIQIVTGAPNVAVSQVVPVALHGAQLPGLKIKRSKLRGVESEGMLCSIEEFGYSRYEFPETPDDGIYILPPETELGLDIRDVLGIREEIIEFEITSNRPDCLAVAGLAREAAVTFDLPYQDKSYPVRGTGAATTAEQAGIRIEAPDLCQRFIGRVVTEVTVEPSPDWLRQRLRCAGIRPINNIVDITNYVMLELGQPMHAYDLKDLAGPEIIVRRAQDQEAMVTLDGQTHRLCADDLVIADRDRVVGLAGVMGAENSEIKPDTRSILLEAARFDPLSVRRSAKRVGLRTEASSRFEKGLDVSATGRAMDMACSLIEQLNCGVVSSAALDVWPVPAETTTVDYRAGSINRLLGTDIAAEEMARILTGLGCQIEQLPQKQTDTGRTADEPGSDCPDDCYRATIPGWRADLEVEADLAEEVARIYGYNKIQPTMRAGVTPTLGRRTAEQAETELLKDLMCGAGFYEACTYSFEKPTYRQALRLLDDSPLSQAVAIRNPLGEDFSLMRTVSVPALLNLAAHNISHGSETGRVFEWLRTYHPLADTHALPDERRHVAAVLWDTTCGQTADLYLVMKGVCERLAKALRLPELRWARDASLTWLHPGQSARILVDELPIGWLGVVHPETATAFDVSRKAALLDLDYEAIKTCRRLPRIFRATPRFPAVTRDLSLVCARETLVQTVRDLIFEHGGDYLKDVSLFDVYQGSQLAEDQKSLAFTLSFASDARTLTDDEINPLVDTIVAALAAHGIVQRS